MNHRRIKRPKANISCKKVKWFVVFIPNTIINPRAMMVHFKNALIAFRTMMSSNRFPFDYFTFLASCLIFVRFDHFHISRVRKSSDQVWNPSKKHKSIENPKMEFSIWVKIRIAVRKSWVIFIPVIETKSVCSKDTIIDENLRLNMKKIYEKEHWNPPKSVDFKHYES